MNRELKYKLLNLASTGIVVLAVAIVAWFAFLKLYPFEVLKDWKLTVPSGTYHQGDQIIAHTELDKVMNLPAHAHRNIECKNKAGSFVSYHLADVEGNNSKTGHISRNIPFKVPIIIPDLPTTCRFSIEADYVIYSFREVNEYTASNTFMVE